jgi:arsenate reductase
MKKRALILCTGNSCRSQMAEGILRHYAGDKFEVFSAGLAPSRVNPTAIEVMKEIGIDISNQRSKHVDEFKGQDFDYVITVCDNAKEACPLFNRASQKIHWSFPDPFCAPANERVNEFRKIRDMIQEKFKQWAETVVLE